MTQVKLKWLDIDGRTPLRAAEGRVTIQPYSRTVIDDAIVTDTPFTLVFEGETVVSLPPSLAGTAYKVTWNSVLDEPWDEYVIVPNVDGVMNYTDLEKVSPETLDPVATPDPEWWARVNAALTGVSVRDGHIYVQTGDGAERYVGDLATGPQGPKGDKGDQGEQGVAGPVGPKGDKGDKGETGKDGVAGPKGDKGDQGVAGPVGPTGPKGDQGLKGETGPIGQTGPKGDKGDQGVAGPKGDRGLTGLTGPAGKDGESAYQIAVRYGYTGSEQEWIESLKAVAGEGISGESAYQIAVRYGYTGTEEEWLVSLVGRRGETGPKGDQGDRGLTGPVGPKGDKGETGPTGPQGPKGDSAYEVAVKNGYIGTESEWLATLKAEGGGSAVLPSDVLTLKRELIGRNQFSFETTARANMRIGEYNRDRYIPQEKMTDSSGVYTVYSSKGYAVQPGDTIRANGVRSMRVERTANYNILSTRYSYQGDSSKIVNTNSYSYKNDTGAEIHYVYFDTVVKDGSTPPETMVYYDSTVRPYENPIYSNKPLLVDFTGLSVDKGFIVDDLNDLRTAAYGMDTGGNLSNFNLSYNMAVRDQYSPSGLLDANFPSLYPGRSQFVVFNNGFDTTRISSSIKQIGYPIPGNTRNVALILHYTYGRYGFALVWLTTPSVQSGTGRPDVPATTGKMITGSEAIGHRYYSTDGAGVGAVEWMKMDATRWKVTNGDTGEKSLSGKPMMSVLFPEWNASKDILSYRIVDGVIYWYIQISSAGMSAGSYEYDVAQVEGLKEIAARLDLRFGKDGRIFYSPSTGKIVRTSGALSLGDGLTGTQSYPLNVYPTILPS